MCDGLGWVTKDPETRAVGRCPECAIAESREWAVDNLPERLRQIPAVPKVLDRRIRAVIDSGWPAPGKPWAVVLWGATGTGKSYEGTWLWRELVLRSGKPAAWLNLHHELEQARRGVNGPEEHAFISKALRSGVVMFDDLSNEAAGTIRERLVLETLGVRYERSLPTIITTNLSGNDIWDGRLASRMRAGIVMHYTGDDRRALKENA